MTHPSFSEEWPGSRDHGTAENEGNCRLSPDSPALPDIKCIINIPEIQDMMNYFYELTHIGMAITDMSGDVLVATGWQDICTKFHRCHPQALKNCIESDTYITRNPVKGKFTLYKCKNNMWDMATPLYIGDRHVANLFLGQFFFDDEVPDYKLFRAQAEKYGFDVEKYLAALDRTPRWSREKVQTAMEFYVRLAGMINTLSYNNVQLRHMLREQQHAELALRESERKFQAIFDQTFQYTGLMTPDGTLIEANRSALDIIGAKEEEVINRLFWDTPWWTHSRPLQDTVWQAIEKAARGEFVRFEATHPAADGRLCYVDFSIKPVRDEAGRVILLIPEGRDITERKRFEKDLGESKARAELYLDLMGHDINNIHQIAIGYLELALDRQPVAGQREFLDKPIEVLQRSARLIQNVRKLQKLQDGTFQAGPVDTCQVLANVQREYGAMPGKAINLDINGHEHCYVSANALLYDVFANLVSNAIKHTGDRVDIVINLDVVGDKGDSYCMVTVEDNGPGIPDDFKGRVFNRMLKGNDKSKGMGLGLYLVKSLVESYRGHVWVEDRVPGDHTKGAKFAVKLPVAGQ